MHLLLRIFSSLADVRFMFSDPSLVVQENGAVDVCIEIDAGIVGPGGVLINVVNVAGGTATGEGRREGRWGGEGREGEGGGGGREGRGGKEREGEGEGGEG